MEVENPALEVTLQSCFRVVLVEPGESLNIGSVSRAMHNLGFSGLDLVAPPRFDLERARRTACQAGSVLDGAIHHSDLSSCLKSTHDVVGFTSEAGRDRRSLVTLSEWCEELESGGLRSIALVFGPEDTGLRREHLSECRRLVRIPSHEENRSFNLAQAVLIVLYEISKHSFVTSWQAIDREPATIGEMYQLDRMVEQLAILSGFYREGTSERVPEIVKNLLRRIEPDAREMGILLGLFGKLQRTLENSK